MKPLDIKDLRPTIIPKSDQLNSDQLLSGSRVIRITSVDISSAGEQPVIVHYDGEGGRPWKPCKTMRKVMIAAWGHDGTRWAGNSVELYTDPSVLFGGEEVGGIRIRRMSGIQKRLRVSLTATRGKKALYEIDPLPIAETPPANTQEQEALTAWSERIARMVTADEFTAAFPDAKKAPKAVRAMFSDAVLKAGLAFDEKTNTYVKQPELAEARFYRDHVA